MRKITTDDLQEGMICDQTICTNHGLILVARGVKLTANTISRLRKFNIETLNVKDAADKVEYSNLSTVIAQKTAAAVDDSIHHELDARTINVKNKTDEIKQVMESVLKRPFIQEFLQAYFPKTQLYRHSLRSAILSIHMGLLMKWDAINLEYLAMCAILHDCGMEREFAEEDREHPFLGFLKLREHLEIDMLIAVVCLQHHENYNGSGFPFSIKRDQIVEFARVLAIVDYYDRSLMTLQNPSKAMFETIGKKNQFFDPKFVDVFALMIDWSRLYNISPKA